MSAISSTGITASSGLISGLPIQDTVDQLIEVSSIPRNQLSQRTSGLQAERNAVDTLATLVLSFRSSLSSLNLSTAFSGRAASSSDSDAVSVSIDSDSSPALASYQFTPLRTASANQYVSSSLADSDGDLGDGVFRLSLGGQLDSGVDLAEINSGTGFSPGEVSITDRSGETATVDLRAATTVEDILEAINNTDGIDITASTDGDQFVLTDSSGGTGSISITDLSGGEAAASLGLSEVASVGDTLTGADIFGLSTSTRLSTLNNGRGVDLDGASAVDDLEFTLADGTTGIGVDLEGATTLGDIIDAINNDEDLTGKVTASISTDGNRLVLTDTTGGTGALSVSNGVLGNTTADDLGLTNDTDTDDATVTGQRLVSGLQDTLLSSLNGGAGVDRSGLVITDRNGSSATIDLSSVETVSELLAAVNAESGIDVTASLNDSRGGILITANSGSGNLTIGENGGTSAADLGLTIDDAVDTVDSGLLGRASVSRTTELADFNGGSGVARGQITITDSTGNSDQIDLRFTGEDSPTLGDVIDEINDATIGVTASLNASGDGILLTDTAGGSGTLTVAEVGSSSTASDLRLLGSSGTTDGSGQQTIDGTGRVEIDLAEIVAAGIDTPLSSLNSGNGVDQGVIRIYDSTYDEDAGTGFDDINLTDVTSLGDIIDRINAADGVDVTAELNSSGTGINITDNSDGAADLIIEDVGGGTTASDLGIDGTFSTGESAGSSVLSNSGGLELLATQINEAGGGFTAAVVFDGFGYRLSITSDQTGSDGNLLIDQGTTGLGFTETSRGTDAVAIFGTIGSGGFSVRSDDGTYNELVSGLDISVSQADGETVSIDVTNDDSSLTGFVQDFVNSYNSLRSNLDQVTDFDAEAETTGVLFGSNVALQVDTQFGSLLSGRFTFGTSYTSLESVGVSLNDDGTLSFDQSKFEEALADDRTAVTQLFQDEDNGVVAELEELANRLAGTDGLLEGRSDALENTIQDNNDRIADLDASLEAERERLLLEFIALEEIIASLTANTDLLSSISPISVSTS